MSVGLPENHRTQKQFDYYRVIKLALFEFVNSFMSLFYIAFYIQDLEMLRGVSRRGGAGAVIYRPGQWHAGRLSVRPPSQTCEFPYMFSSFRLLLRTEQSSFLNNGQP